MNEDKISNKQNNKQASKEDNEFRSEDLVDYLFSIKPTLRSNLWKECDEIKNDMEYREF